VLTCSDLVDEISRFLSVNVSVTRKMDSHGFDPISMEISRSYDQGLQALTGRSVNSFHTSRWKLQETIRCHLKTLRRDLRERLSHSTISNFWNWARGRLLSALQITSFSAIPSTEATSVSRPSAFCSYRSP
jgi:hypothetical protein